MPRLEDHFRIDKVLYESNKHFSALGTCLLCGCNKVKISADIEEPVRDYGEDWDPYIMARHEKRFSCQCPDCGQVYEGL